MHKKIIVLVGAPCSGKSTIGKLTANNNNITYISSGDIARKMAEQSVDIKNNLNNGKLAPEGMMRYEIFNTLWYHLMEMNEDTVVLDGFPRFGEQAEWLYNLASDIKIVYVLIHSEMSTIIERSNARNRSDDKNLMQRLDYYYNTTFKDLQPYIDYIINSDEYDANGCATLLEEIMKGVVR